MPVKYISYIPETTDGQAILDNFTRTRRILRYRENNQVVERIKRGLPLYEVETTERVESAELRVADKTESDSPHSTHDSLLIRGECLSACAYLKDKGIKVDLVYIDPPFASGADYARKVYLRKNPVQSSNFSLPAPAKRGAEHAEARTLNEGEEVEIDEYKAFEEKMYGDIWNKEAYLNWMYENLTAIRSIMSETGSIYLHIDWHIGHYIKILMDEVFGEDNFINEIIWYYPGREMHIPNKFNSKHDTIFLYGLADEKRINMSAVALPYEREERIKSLRRKIHKDENGLEWVWETRGQAAGQEPYKRSKHTTVKRSLLKLSCETATKTNS